MSTRGFHDLQVLETRTELDGMAKTVLFDVPHSLSSRFQWQAGQHLSLRFQIAGENLRRSYSISSSPHSPKPIQITVKRVSDGRVSNHINDEIQAGDTIPVMPPFGRFCLQPESIQRRTHYFFAAGSGITPIYAMLTSVLLAEPWSDVHLLYGNASADSILFRDALQGYAEQFPGRFSLRHVLSAPSMWSGFDYWRRGKIDAAAVAQFISETPPYAQDAQYYVCGLGGMNDAVRDALVSLDVPEQRIHSENYGGRKAQTKSNMGVSANARISLSGQTYDVQINAGETLLQAARRSGLEPPFSCQAGVCGACRAKLNTGQVHMDAHMALDDADVAKGTILACQAAPLSAKLEIDFG